MILLLQSVNCLVGSAEKLHHFMVRVPGKTVSEHNESHVILIDQHRHHWLLLGGWACKKTGGNNPNNWRTEVGIAAALQGKGKLEKSHSTFFFFLTTSVRMGGN